MNRHSAMKNLRCTGKSTAGCMFQIALLLKSTDGGLHFKTEKYILFD